MRPASRIRRRVRSPCRVTSSHVSLITRSPASSRSASLAASRSRSRRVRWNSKPSSWTARRCFGQKASTSWVAVSPLTAALKVGLGMSVVGLYQCLEAAFEFAFLGARLVGGDHLSQEAGSPPAPGAVKELCRCPEVEQPQPLGTVDGNRQFVRLDDSTEIEEGSSRAGYRDAVVDGEVLGSRHAGPVDPHARWAMPPGGHDHLHVRCIRAEPPQVRRRAVAKPGAGPAGHHGREIPTARRHLRHPDGIDAAVDAMQAGPARLAAGPSTGRAPGPVTAAPRSPRAAARPALRSPDRPQVRNPIAVSATRITHPARVAPGA